MPKVHFLSDNVTVEVAAGTQLAGIVDDEGLAIPFGCRDGQCGTCMVIVREGIDNLAPMDGDERETLEMNDAAPNNRLTCQAIVNGDISIEPV